MSAGRTDWTANSIKRFSRGQPNSAWHAFEQLLAAGAPDLPAEQRPCFQHFGTKTGCKSERCLRSHDTPAGPALAVAKAAAKQVHAACSEQLRSFVKADFGN